MAVKAGYKQTEIGLIPEDWATGIISDIIAINIQNGVFTEPARKGRGNKLINVADLYNKFPVNLDNLELFQANNKEKLRFNLENGDILFTRSSLTADGIARCNICADIGNQQIVFDCHLIRIRPNSRLSNPFFIAKYCASWVARSYLIANAKTTTMTTIDQSVIINLPIPLPPLPEQQAIAQALSDVDQLIASLDQLIEKRRALKTATMQQLLTGKTRLAGFSGEWETKRLGTLLHFQVGFPFKSMYFNENQQGMRLIKNRDLKNDEQPFWYNGNYETNYIVRNGDLLIGMDGDFIPCIWSKGEALLNQRVGRILSTEVLHQNFAYYYLIAPMKDIEIATAATTVKHLSHSDIENIEKPIPTYSEQQAIAEVLSDMDAEITELEQRRDKTIAIKQGMMQELLTGRTRLI
jgi:type I restriction enzyme S subunit